jgi:hypothetical protein
MEKNIMNNDHTEDFIIAAFAKDFWIAFLEKPKFIRWFVRLLMGRYAWNELVGIKQRYEENWSFKLKEHGYDLKDCDYHKELDKYKDW